MFCYILSLRDGCLGDFSRLCQYSKWVRCPRAPMHSRAVIHRNVTAVLARSLRPLFGALPQFLRIVQLSASLGQKGVSQWFCYILSLRDGCLGDFPRLCQ